MTEEALHPVPGTAERLERFSALLLEWNAKVNLTAARDPAAVAVHIRDSLSLAPFVRGPLVDVGSGGGFPAIPLAIATGVTVVLIESVAKKARFLTEALRALGIDGRVVCERAEVAARQADLRERFASATARAVGSLSTVLELTVPFLDVSGRALLQRGREEPGERAAGDDAALVLGAARVDEVAVDGMRRIVIFEKRAATPGRFPRRGGAAAKRPLCVVDA
jgi:16S rRNA (guanine527-N7)-methyltransferase